MNYKATYNVPYFIDDAESGNTPGIVTDNQVKYEFYAADDAGAAKLTLERLAGLERNNPFPNDERYRRTLESLVEIRTVDVRKYF